VFFSSLYYFVQQISLSFMKLIVDIWPIVLAILLLSLLLFLQGTLAAARRAAAFVRGDDVLHKLFTELAYRYK